MEEELYAKAIADFIAYNSESIYSSTQTVLEGTKRTIKSRLKKTYSAYLQRTLARYSKSKSFFHKSEAEPIYNFFVSPDISNEKRSIKKPEISSITKSSPFFAISGSGGSGKTMLLRHLFISCIKDKRKTPVLIELRSLNNSNKSIQSSILDTLNLNGIKEDRKYLELAIESGHFCILLDGFDEIEFARRKKLSKQIQSLASKYPKNWIAISTRPDQQIQAWPDFNQFRIEPFDLDRAIELVDKVPFDKDIKENFTQELKAELYKKHKSFLSNPLLLSIMLLTYYDNAKIPNKLSVFYRQAFEALFHRHDAKKSGFQRDMHSKLDISDFEKAFSSFCVLSHINSDYNFSQAKAIEYFDKAKNLANLKTNYKSSEILKDSTQAVCLLIEEGMDYSFTHRSFQEYFTAKYICTAPTNKKRTIISKFAKRIRSDKVVNLLFEMDQIAVEEHYILPTIKELKDTIELKSKIGVSHYLRYLKSSFDNMTLLRFPDFKYPRAYLKSV